MPILFLSHSGADTEAARSLKKLIDGSPTAKEAGLEVWFDKDDLHAGKSWQKQLAETIQIVRLVLFVPPPDAMERHLHQSEIPFPIRYVALDRLNQRIDLSLNQNVFSPIISSVIHAGPLGSRWYSRTHPTSFAPSYVKM
jgi:hypothetical protein